MGFTIPRRWPHNAPFGDHAAHCSDCGARYQRSKLNERDGLWLCSGANTRNCYAGRRPAELSRLNAEQAGKRHPPRPWPGGGAWDERGFPNPVTGAAAAAEAQRTDADDIGT